MFAIMTHHLFSIMVCMLSIGLAESWMSTNLVQAYEAGAGIHLALHIVLS